MNAGFAELKVAAGGSSSTLAEGASNSSRAAVATLIVVLITDVMLRTNAELASVLLLDMFSEGGCCFYDGAQKKTEK